MTEIRLQPENESVQDPPDPEAHRVIALPDPAREQSRRYGGPLFGGGALLLLLFRLLQQMLGLRPQRFELCDERRRKAVRVDAVENVQRGLPADLGVTLGKAVLGIRKRFP